MCATVDAEAVDESLPLDGEIAAVEKRIWAMWVFSSGAESDGGDTSGVFVAEESDERVSSGEETTVVLFFFTCLVLAEERTCCYLSLEVLREQIEKGYKCQPFSFLFCLAF